MYNKNKKMKPYYLKSYAQQEGKLYYPKNADYQ